MCLHVHTCTCTVPDLFIDGDIEDDEEEEGDESMDHQIEVDAVDLDIGRVGSHLCWQNLFIENAGITAQCANICVKYLDYLMLKELRNVVAE